MVHEASVVCGCVGVYYNGGCNAKGQLDFGRHSSAQRTPGGKVTEDSCGPVPTGTIYLFLVCCIPFRTGLGLPTVASVVRRARWRLLRHRALSGESRRCGTTGAIRRGGQASDIATSDERRASAGEC